MTHAREGLFRMFSTGTVILRAFKGGEEASELVETNLQTVNRSMKKRKLRDMFSPAIGSGNNHGRQNNVEERDRICRV